MFKGGSLPQMMTTPILLLSVIFLIALAKRPKGRRRMGRYVRGTIDVTIDLGTLAAKTGILQALSNVNERTLISSMINYWGLSDFTDAVGDGPIMVGYAHGDYSLTEVEEYLEQADSWNEGNKIAQEIGKRQIRRVGVFKSSVADSQGSAVLNDGKPIRTKLNWILNQGQTINVWAYNMGDSALATTDPDLVVSGHANLWPR